MFMNRKTCYCQDVSFSQPDRFDTISVKIPASYILDINKLIRKFVWKDKSPRRANPNWKKKNKVTGLCVPNIQTYYKAAVGTSLVAQ